MTRGTGVEKGHLMFTVCLRLDSKYMYIDHGLAMATAALIFRFNISGIIAIYFM